MTGDRGAGRRVQVPSLAVMVQRAGRLERGHGVGHARAGLEGEVGGRRRRQRIAAIELDRAAVAGHDVARGVLGRDGQQKRCCRP